MDPLQQKINTEQSNRLEEILQQMDPSLLQGYKKFMHELIIQAISHHDFTVDTLNRSLLDLNKDVMNQIVQKALSYYEMHAPRKDQVLWDLNMSGQ